MERNADRALALSYGQTLGVVVDDERARFSSWYELFPRSCAPTPGKHGTFKDAKSRCRAIAAMGFDVVYFPPIHPIGSGAAQG
jgi:starch synthase (maltosyl-transferring)